MTAYNLLDLAIRLGGHDLDPEQVSATLGIQYSRAQKRGGPRASSKKYVAKFGMWVLEVDSRSKSLAELTERLLKKIGKPPVPLNAVQGVEDAHFEVFFGMADTGKKNALEFSFSNEHLARIHQFRAFDFCHYHVTFKTSCQALASSRLKSPGCRHVFLCFTPCRWIFFCQHEGGKGLLSGSDRQIVSFGAARHVSPQFSSSPSKNL